jgi:chromatin remodeling complex protein RSC6
MSKDESSKEWETDSVQWKFNELLKTLSGLKTQITGLVAQVRNLERQTNKKIKNLQKEAKKNKNKGNRKPSGFAVPSKISNDLCKFMKKPVGTEMARTEVTKHIIQYITEHKLQNPSNRKVIKPDKALKSLLQIKKGDDDVTYFNIQRYMNKHFISQ